MQPMKRTFRSAIWPLLGLLTVACAAPDGRNLPAAEDFESLSAQFAAPSKEYGSAPLFVWNKVVTPERIDEAMADLKDKGFGGVFVHPRPGMVTQYLDDNWFSLFRHTMEKGRELDMNVWIYDENSYPSGFAGGHVNEAMPESYDEGVALKYLRAGVLPDTVDRFFCCLRREGDAFTDITAEAVSRRGEKGDYYLFYKAYNPTSPWYSGFSYVDLMHEGVADKFIELTLDGYKKVVGEEFGGTVPGWFTDEPQIVVTDRESIRWTPDLFDAFRARWGYDLEPNLVSLWEEVGPWRQVRHNYRDVLMNLFLDRYIKVCHDYCERNNLVFTGHFWEHGWPDMGHNPDNMAMYAWQQMPGIDLLYNKFDVESPNAHFGNVRSVKEVNSAANQMGRVRKLSESYGGGGWDMTLRDFKRQGDWEYALGRELHEPAYRTAEHRRCAQVRLSARLHAPFAVVGVLPRAEPPLRPSVAGALVGRPVQRRAGARTHHLDLDVLHLQRAAPEPLADDGRGVPGLHHRIGTASGGVRSGVGEHPAQPRFGQGRPLRRG